MLRVFVFLPQHVRVPNSSVRLLIPAFSAADFEVASKQSVVPEMLTYVSH